MASVGVVSLLLLTACGGGSATITGEMAEGVEAAEVWALGGTESAVVEEGVFRLEGVEGDTVELRIRDAEGEEKRMRLIGVAGEELTLREIWFDGELAHPFFIDASRPVTANGVRMGGDAGEGEVGFSGTVLAVNDDGDALLLRPLDEVGADQRVVVTPGTLVRTVDGDPADAEELEFGDTVTASGERREGFVIAVELEVSRGAARD